VTRWLSLALLLALLVPAAARADGDPASDYLLTQPVFTPFSEKIPQASVDQLLAIQNEAKRKGYEVRVALIASRTDLGSVPSLFGKPEPYARFLWQEIRFVYHGPLLVVMPDGYGYWQQGGKADAALARLAKLPKPATHPDLARAAVPAVQAVAAANGVAVSIPAAGTATSHTRDRILIAAGAVALVALVLGAYALRRRRRTS
jgi:hypothetical protein